MQKLLLISLYCALSVARMVRADIYMHNPAGSNDRGCETNENRNNGNRLFDSQNNAKGGYACRAAYPFACYLLETEAERDACNELNANSPDDLATAPVKLMDNGGVLSTDPTATRTQRLSFIEGSQLTIEWTNQHGCGDNPKTHCDVIIQYACEDTLTDDCGDSDPNTSCGPRDGLPITNSDVDRGTAQYADILNPGQNININRRSRDRDSTETIPTSISNNVQSDPRFGRHEPLNYFVACAQRERNKGLFLADQNVNGQRATHTRQNPNGNRNGLECPEESEYFPYWHPSPWKDVAILTDQIDRCAELQAESQNVKAKNFCECPSCVAQNKVVPNQEVSCLKAGGQWKEQSAFGIAAPFCGKAPTTRENHLGNPVGQGSIVASAFNWTIPKQLQGNTCILRIRYNVSTGDDISAQDQRDVTVFGTNAQNGVLSPLKDRQNNEVLSYVKFTETQAKVGLEINTNQFGRTFQDRSHSFSIKPRPNSGPCSAAAVGSRIYNLNTRGKRGNIVQVYPAVEYDFVPSELSITTEDCVHVQWSGSDYNPARNDNDAFGGPNDPKNMNDGRADRSNLVQLAAASNYQPVSSLESEMILFTASLEQKKRLVFLDQKIDDPQACLDITAIRTLSNLAKQGDTRFVDNGNNFLDSDQDKDRFFKNCAKLSGQRSPFFDGGLLKAGTLGTHFYYSTRNTCFSNRNQQGILHVLAAGSIPPDAGSPGFTGANVEVDPTPIAAGIGGGLAAALAFAGLVVYRRRSSSDSGGRSGLIPSAVAQGFSNFRQSFADFSGFKQFHSTASPTNQQAGGLSSMWGKPSAAPPMMAVAGFPGNRGMQSATNPVYDMENQAYGMGRSQSPQQGARAMAMYDHRATEPGELTFRKGDQIRILRRDASGWWEGEFNGQRGIFPANYVRTQSQGWN